MSWAVQGWDDDCNTRVFVCVHVCVCVSMPVFVGDGYFDDAGGASQRWWHVPTSAERAATGLMGTWRGGIHFSK